MLQRVAQDRDHGRFVTAGPRTVGEAVYKQPGALQGARATWAAPCCIRKTPPGIKRLTQAPRTLLRLSERGERRLISRIEPGERLEKIYRGGERSRVAAERPNRLEDSSAELSRERRFSSGICDAFVDTQGPIVILRAERRFEARKARL